MQSIISNSQTVGLFQDTDELNTTSFSQTTLEPVTTPLNELYHGVSSYNSLAASLSFLSMPRYFTPENSKAVMINAVDGSFQMESLFCDYGRRFSHGRLSGKIFQQRIHFFNSLDSEGDTEISLHDHLLPIGVLPFHPEGRYGEVAYKMVIENQDSNGSIVQYRQDYAQFGVSYGLDNPLHDRHDVISSKPHLSFVVADYHGPKNNRPTNEVWSTLPNSRRDELLDIALKAHKMTISAKKDFLRSKS